VPSPAAGDAFGAALYGALGAQGNTIISPASVASVLQLALLGARGDTAAGLAAAARLAGPDEAAAGLRELSAWLDGLAGGPVTVRAPGTLWVQAGLPLRPEFTAALAGLAAVSVHGADFRAAAEAAREEINELIAAQTAGKITGLLPPGSVDVATRLVLASAVYLKAAWAQPFPAAATADGPFHPGPGRATTVPLMRLRARLRYRHGAGCQVAELPYAGGGLAMLIVLPDGGLAPVEEQLAAGGLAGLSTGLAAQPVSLVLPRFRVRAAVDLRPVLTALGAGEMFTAGADFSGITGDGRLSAGAVAHQAWLDVNEQGTEAAAATAMTIVRARAVFGGQPAEMVVDRPFLVAITGPGGGAPLFLGRVTNPAAG
jgi:serine protease inhibitor